MLSIAAAQALTIIVINSDKPYVKNNRYLFFRPYFFMLYSRKNGLKRDQFNTLLIDRKERCATYKCSTVRYV
ncbi:hypothetical protein B9P84_17220 [Citrobacter braakii]|uniref:Uncharacterized protein n=1 Tax=Citrobacter braakii TaxID=57706 RepID=A0A1R0FQH2_CITBR|nr:hypothetical protein WG82_05440 [Citrobacter amalonaticus]KLQ21769.1 hypothetical protein ABR34_14350 [Citrobacter braakii]OCF82726.1 hypothetical protein AS299_21675 [Citrobacter freundii]PLC60695.1 hypothetical protein B9P82_23585 [Citrobacter sp. L55]OLY66926.1 hypothetical protein BWD41_23040 [Citrobacter braakii]